MNGICRLAVTPLFAFIAVFVTALPAKAQQQDSVREVYQSWVVQCIRGETGQRCSLIHEIRQSQSGQRMLFVSIDPPSNNQARMTIFTPLGVRLANGLRFTLDGESFGLANFRNCLPAGCRADVDIPLNVIGTMAAGTMLRVVIVADDNAGGNPLNLDVPMTGLMDAWNRLIALNRT